MSNAVSRPDLKSADRPYRVVILSGAKRGQWGSYATIEQAAEVAAKLRRHGMHAVVEELAT